MSRDICIAGIQAKIDQDIQTNRERLRAFTETAVKQGAEIVLLPELFETYYFCTKQKEEFFALAHEIDVHPTVQFFQRTAKELKVAMPISVFEKSGPHYFNSIVMIDDRGEVLGTYRKSHIPDGPGYQEKFYFRPGNTGFRVWSYRSVKIGVGICWDQWFPEAARIMALKGAELLLYPTAIGSEPEAPDLDTSRPWQRAMQGHAVSNVTPVMAINRVGQEPDQRYYGCSFICDHQGEMKQEAARDEEKILIQSFDMDAIQKYRASFGFFRDRRPELYAAIIDQAD